MLQRLLPHACWFRGIKSSLKAGSQAWTSLKGLLNLRQPLFVGRLFFRRELRAVFNILVETRHDGVNDHLDLFRRKFFRIPLA